MFILGLTGSIGMGKSTTAKFFREAGVPVHDSDAVVHRLYEGEAVAPVEAAFPGVTRRRQGRPRQARATSSSAMPDAIKQLEAIVHPLVRAVSERFISEQRRARRARRSCSTFRCCSRPAARRVSMPSWWSRRRPTCSARAC